MSTRTCTEAVNQRMENDRVERSRIAGEEPFHVGVVMENDRMENTSYRMERAAVFNRIGFSRCAFALFLLAGLSGVAQAARKCPDGSPAGPANQCPSPVEPKENDAQFLGVSVPASMVVGQSYTASVSFKNIGWKTWTPQEGFRLGSQSPTDNAVWGTRRVELASSVNPDATVTFNFAVHAPLTGGKQLFQWRMVKENVAWFGGLSAPVEIEVVPSLIKGNIDTASDTGISGWACSTHLNPSIDVRLYLEGPAGTGNFVAATTANRSSDPAIASACNAAGGNYRFWFPIDENFLVQNAGKLIYIHGVSPVGASDSAIAGSGVLSVALVRRDAEFVSQNMPAQVSTGGAYSGSVRVTNTGNTTWRQGQGYRVGLVGDTSGWSPGEVGLASDVPPGASVDFNFSLHAPLAAGGYSVHWRMRGGSGDFGGASASQRVQVVAPPPVEHGVGSVARSYVYDANQQLCKVIEPESGATVLAYDAAGNLLWSASGLDLPSTTSCDLDAAAASARQVRRGYDRRNRLQSLRFPDGNGDQDWSYTPDGLALRVTTLNDAGSTWVVNTYSYDTRRQLTSESSEQVGLSHWSIGYGYDANAALSSQTYPSGTVVNYAPNALGQPTAVRDQTGNSYATGIVYFPNGAVRQFVYGNGVIHSLVLNGRQLPQQVRDANVASLEYQYDANGNVTTILDQQRGADYNRSMHYDGLDRLSEAGSVQFGGDHWNRYTYDVFDNMLTSKLPGVSEHNYWYDANNRLTNIQNNAGATIFGLSYDAQGNLKNKNGQAFLFDYGNRLREVVGKESYRYDAYGHRVFSGGASASNLQIYSRAGRLLYAQTPSNSGTEYIYLNTRLLATRTAAAITFQHTDALGSPIAVTDASGHVIDRTDYQPYGSAIDKTVDGIGYTGQAMDAATGLTYMQQRYYDPHVKRFISVDPVAADSVLAANFNRYWYANNNPYRFTDPDGRQSVGEMIDRNAMNAAASDNHLVTYGWAFAATTWGFFGAEGVSQLYDKGINAGTGNGAMAVLEIATLGKGKLIGEAGETLWKASRLGAFSPQHIFSADHVKQGIMDLGKNMDVIVGNTHDVIMSADKAGLLKNGMNTIITAINGHTATVRAFFKNGELQSMNAFKGTSEREAKNVIDLRPKE